MIMFAYDKIARAGWVVASMNYRLAPRVSIPDQIADIKRGKNQIDFQNLNECLRLITYNRMCYRIELA